LIQVGVVIANPDPDVTKRKILGEGWNRMPVGCEGKFKWGKGVPDILKSKYPYGEFHVFLDTPL
jgi:hypothetical protein